MRQYNAEQALKVADSFAKRIRKWEKKYDTNYLDQDFFGWGWISSNCEDEILDIIADANIDQPRYLDKLIQCRLRDDEYKIVEAYRYGLIPKEGASYNYRDQEWEAGVSVLPYGEEDSNYYNAFFGDNKLYKVRGLDFGYTGSDGEPILFGAEIIEEVKR